MVVNFPNSPSIKKQLEMEKDEDKRQRRDRQASDITKILCANRKKRSIAEIVLAVSYVTGEPVSLILGLNRSRRIIEARAAVCIIARLSGYSFPRIGEAIGRDHSSVQNLCKKAALKFDVDMTAKKAAKVLGMELFQ